MQLLECSAIVNDTLTLVVGGGLSTDVGALRPSQSQPAEVLQHGSDKIEPEAHGIQVVVTENKRTSSLASSLRRYPKCARMTKVQMAGGRRRETPTVDDGRQDELRALRGVGNYRIGIEIEVLCFSSQSSDFDDQTAVRLLLFKRSD